MRGDSESNHQTNFSQSIQGKADDDIGKPDITEFAQAIEATSSQRDNHGGSRLHMSGSMVSDIRPPAFLIPPPEALIAKTVQTKEEARGATSFVQIQRLIGKERIERLNKYKEKRNREPVEATGNMSEYMVENWRRNRLIYCRFGEKHLETLEKRKNSHVPQQ